ncbi:hypothetical protein GCM10023223_51370 [Stackebrandtia albiflava]
MRIGRVFGVPVIVSPTWLILAVLVTVIYSDIVQAAVPGISGGLVYVVSFGFVVTLCVSVFLHELGHALVSRHYGIEVRSITLEMLGGHTEMASEAQSPKVEAAVALAGPLVSAVLGVAGVAALALTPPGGLATQFAFQIAASNIIVAVYNALPGMPLDGGRALRALVWAIKGDRHLASRVAGWTGRAVAVATGLGGALLYFCGVVTTIGIVFALLIAGVLWLGATRSIQIGQLGARFHLLDVRSLLRPAAPVTTGTPLAEALRRMREAEAVSVVVVGSNGEPLALLSGPAARAVPEHRRPWIPVDDVSRAITPETAWDPRWRGDEVVDAMRRHHAPEYAVMFGGRFEGLVRASDIADVLDPRRPVPTTGTAAPADTGTVPHRQEDDQT